MPKFLRDATLLTWAVIAPAGMVLVSAPCCAKTKTLPWDLQMKADVFVLTKLPEYLALAKVCRRPDADASMAARIIANYATLYAKPRDEAQKQFDRDVETAVMNHGRMCAPADTARFKQLYPAVEEMDGFMSTAAKDAAAHPGEKPEP